MSKKKAFSGNTMTLKDFHGGSIPTDLPLPSAPGVVVRPTDRSVFDRPATWGNPMGRSDQRTRPSSSPATRFNFDDKTPFLTHTAHVGRNFDEDERKPLDGVSVPRRNVTDDTFRVVAPSKVELRPESAPLGTHPGSAPVSPLSNRIGNSYAGMVSDVAHVSVTSNSASGTYPNAWGVRKDVIVGSSESAVQLVSSVSKMAHASALDKVISGRWQSKQSVNYQPEVVEINRFLETETVLHSKGHDDKSAIVADVVQHARPDGRLGGSEMHPAMSSQLSERPKLKLLPRTKPIETVESPIEPKQAYQHPIASVHNGPPEAVNELHGNLNHAKPSLVASEIENQAIERPKLNLKPRSQPIESSAGRTWRERNGLFGGARPREMILKERGVDNVAINHQELDQNPDRIKKAVTRTEKVPDSSRHSENVGVDQRSLKKPERKDNNNHNQVDDMRKRNWRKTVERQPSPETWRKTVDEQPKPFSDAVGSRYGKTASAVDLALAFSKSHSDPKTDERYTGQRRAQIPFSRLTAPTTQNSRHQINGY